MLWLLHSTRPKSFKRFNNTRTKKIYLQAIKNAPQQIIETLLTRSLKCSLRFRYEFRVNWSFNHYRLIDKPTFVIDRFRSTDQQLRLAIQRNELNERTVERVSKRPKECKNDGREPQSSTTRRLKPVWKTAKQPKEQQWIIEKKNRQEELVS